MCTVTGSCRKMDSQEHLHVMQERIIKTDEVIRLLEAKKKEINKLDKSYKKLIEKFCVKNSEVLKLKIECQTLNNRVTNCPEIHLPCEKKIKELITQNELLEKNHNVYVNTAEKKYQSAYQEIVSLTETCDSLNKKIEKIGHKETKTKSVKKLQEALIEVKGQLKDSIVRYDELESASNKTISDLKKECKNLEERRNETLRQLAKVRLDCDELRKSLETSTNSPTKSKLHQKIEKLETKIQSFEIEQDILNQSHENDIAALKKQHENEKKILEFHLKELKIKINEETIIRKEKQAHENYITELTKKHESEKKLLEDQIEKLRSKINNEVKNHENDKKHLKDQLDELKNKINEGANKIKETIGTQTDYEDIYNLEDILTEMYSLPALMSPLISESSVKQDDDVILIRPLTCSIAVGPDNIIPTFIDSSSQTCDINQSKMKVKPLNLSTAIINNINILVEKSKCSVGTQTDVATNNVIQTSVNSCSQLCEFLNTNQSKIKVKSFNLSSDILNKTNTSVDKLTCSTKLQMNGCLKLSGSDLWTEVTEDTGDIYVHLIPIESTTIGTNDIPSIINSESANANQSKIKVRSFDLCTEKFNETLVEKSTSFPEMETDACRSLTDSSTQTSYQNETDFKSFVSSIVTIPKNDILEEMPKIVKLKSRVTKKYKNNNKNRLLNTLRNSKLNLKCLLEKYINTSSKFVIVSSSILKSDFSKAKIPDICEQKMEGCANSYCSSCSHTIRHENYCSCSCQQNMFYNRYNGQCPPCQMPCDLNHDMYYRTNNLTNYYNMRQQFKSKYKKIDDDFNSSDSEEEDSNLRQVLREYKHSVIKKYLTDKYLARIAKKNKLPDYFDNNISNKNLFNNNKGKNKVKLSHKDKLKNKSIKSNRIIYSSDSEEDTGELLSNHKNKTNAISRSTILNTMTINMEDDCEKSNNSSSNLVTNKNINSIPEEKKQKETGNYKETSNFFSNSITTNKESNKETNDFSENINIKNVIETQDEISREPDENISRRTKENISKRTEGNFDRSVENNVNREAYEIINRIQDANNSRSLETAIPEENIRRSDQNFNKNAGKDNLEAKKIINSVEVDRSSSTAEELNIIRTFEENIHMKTVNSHEQHVDVIKDNLQPLKTPFTLSKKQQLLLRKGRLLKKGSNVVRSTTHKELLAPKRIYATRSEALKRKSTSSSEVEYKKQKLELFGLDTDSDSDTSNNDDRETIKKVSDVIEITNINNCSSTDKNETLVHSLKQNKTTSTSVPPRTNSPVRSLVSNDEPNNENSSEIITDNIYTSTRKTKARIALKNPERCTNMDVNIETNMEIFQSILSDTSISKEETITPVTTEKVFKRPGILKINLPLTNKNKIQKECQNIVSDLYKDSPDSPDEEINCFNYKLKIPFTSVIKKEKELQGIEKRQQIDIGIAQKLIKDVATSDWNKSLMATVVLYLADKDSATVARLIVNEAAQDFSQEFDKSFTPPAPLLTVTQQKILVLLSQLEKNNLPDIHTLFLKKLEVRVLSETRVEVVHPLTRLYVATCKLKYEIEKVRMLCCNAAYYMSDLLLPFMFIVLTTWGDILPMAANSEDIPLAVAIVHVIHLKTCKQPGYNHMNLNRLLSDYYGYKRGERSNEEIMTQLVRSYSENYSKTAYTAIIILCKNLCHKWTYNQIKNHLLPLLENCNNAENKLMTVSLIQRLISQFPTNADQDDVKNCLMKYVIDPGVVPLI